MPRRSNRAAAEEPGRGSGRVGAAIARHPREFVGLVMAAAAVAAVFVNALFLQKGPHPAPIFATRPPLVAAAPAAPPASPPGSAPAQTRAQLTADIQRELSRRGFYDGPADGIWGARSDAAARDFTQAAGLKLGSEPSEGLLRAITAAKVKAAAAPARNDPIAELIAPSQRILAIQRALADFGYGQLKPTGVYDPQTRAAIEKFERDRRLPLTGQITDRFVRELAAMTGRPLE